MKKIQYPLISIGALLVLLFLIFATTIFLNHTSQIESKKIEENLHTLSQNNVNTVNFAFSEYTRSLFIGLRGIESNSTYKNPEDVIPFLQIIEEEGSFLCVSIDTKENTIYTSCDKVTTLQTIPTYTPINDTTIFISDAYFDTIHETQVVSIKIPMSNAFKGMYLNGKIKTTTLSQMLEKSFFTSGGFFHIIDGNGAYLASSDSGIELLMDISFIEAMPLVTFIDGYDFETTSEAFLSGKTGMTKYWFEGHTRYLYYIPVGISNWMLTSVIPEEEVMQGAQLHQRVGIIFAVSVLTAIAILFMCVFHDEKKAHTETQFLQKSIQSLADITHKAIIEWDYKTHTLSSISDYAALFGRDLVNIDIRKNAEDLPIFCKDDKEIVRYVFDTIVKCEQIQEARFRIKHENGSFLWCKYSSSIVKDTRGNPIKSIAFLENIDSVVRKTEALQKSAELDSLTQTYNKAHTEALISYELENLQDKTAALFILDFDNFKPLNDTFGHQKGDEVLKETVEGLRKIFRSDDIIGRLGGDEFFIYLKSIESIETIKRKADTVCKSLKKTYTEKDKSVTITYSIGISIAPIHGNDFKTLYKTADKALYQVKNSGKDNFSVYNA